MQLTTALNTRPLRSDSDNHQIPGHSTSKHQQIPLKKSDYPNVKHWKKQNNDAAQVSVIKVYDADTGDSDSDSEDTGGIKKCETGILAFLEDENGKVIDCCERDWLYSEF
jgi:hypothetical protein